jgi:amino acid transporter
MSQHAIASSGLEGGLPELKRSLGLADVALFFVVAGSNLQWVATAAGAGPRSLPVWVLGCAVMFVPIAIAVVYLSSHYPDEGGMYVWSKRAFGPFAGFMTGWTYWTSNLPFFPTLLYFTAGNALFISGGSGGALAGSAPYFIAVAIGGLALGTILNIFGLDVGKWLNNVGAASRWVVTLLLIGLGVVAWWKFGPATPITAATIRPGFRIQDLIFWSIIAFAWTGPEAMSFMAGEVKNPRRTIPLGLAMAAPVIGIIYIMGTIAVLAAMKPGDVNSTSGVMQAIGHVADRIGWSVLTPIAAMLVTLSCLGSVGAWLGAVARIPFVAGIDHYLPKAFGQMHPRWGSPVVALLAQAGIASIFIFLGQGGNTVKTAYDTLVGSTLIITFIPFLLLFASAIKLSERSSPQTTRIPGGKFTIVFSAVVGFLTTIGGIILACVPPDDVSDKTLFVLKVALLTALMVGGGVAVYLFGRRRAHAVES